MAELKVLQNAMFAATGEVGFGHFNRRSLDWQMQQSAAL
jgi:hypothetical protein